MNKVKMIALRKTYYDGVNHEEGELFSVEPRYVSILSATKAARVAGEADLASPVQAPTKAKTYNRRDVRAEK